MRSTKREDVSALLHSTWSAFSYRSKRAIAGAETVWNSVNAATAGQSAEYLYLLPGWAVKRRHRSPRVHSTQGELLPFDLHVSTSGFAVALRELSAASATQRAVISIAKRFAALPRLPVEGETDQRWRTADRDHSPEASGSTSQNNSGLRFDDAAAVRLAHTNLDARLSPFWSKPLAGRRVTFALYTVQRSPHDSVDVTKGPAGPLHQSVAFTDEQGLFAQHITIPWERLCTHPQSVALACADPHDTGTSDWELMIEAKVEQSPPELEQRDDASARDAPSPHGSLAYQPRIRSNRSPHHATSTVSAKPAPATGTCETQAVSARMAIVVSEPKGVRVISDLDDTIKHSDILAGPREVFRNVFCRSLHDLCVPGMDQLYRALATEGVDGFHMISNSPFELYATIREFLSIHRFPSMYSLKLKYYGGRSLLSGLMEPAGDRKRPSILEVLDAFPESRFILFGDSGEQDLEVYSALARDRPDQIRGIFIRDVTSGRADALNIFTRPASIDPKSQSDRDIDDTLELLDRASSRPATPIRSDSSSSEQTTSGSVNSEMSDEIRALSSAQQKILRRAALWDVRMEKARREVPDGTVLEFFTDAAEVQATAIPLVKRLFQHA